MNDPRMWDLRLRQDYDRAMSRPLPPYVPQPPMTDEDRRRQDPSFMTVTEFLDAARAAGNPGLQRWTLRQIKTVWVGGVSKTVYDGATDLVGWRLGTDHVLELSGQIGWFWHTSLLVAEGKKPKWNTVSLADRELPFDGLLRDPKARDYETHGSNRTSPVTPQHLSVWLHTAAESAGIPVSVTTPWDKNPELVTLKRFLAAATACGSPGLQTWTLTRTRSVLKSRFLGPRNGYRQETLGTTTLTGWMIHRDYVLESDGRLSRCERSEYLGTPGFERLELNEASVTRDYQLGSGTTSVDHLATWLDRILRETADRCGIPLDPG